MELLQQPRVNSSVRRCLFGPTPPEVKEEFTQTRKEAEMEDALRFKQKWNFDIFNDRFVDGEYKWNEAASDSRIPAVYTKAYSHKCKRRALRPCFGKNLSFVDSDQENCDVTLSSPVQYDSAASTMVFIGINTLPHQPPREPVTPKKVGGECCPKPTLSLLTTDRPSDAASVSSPSSLWLRRRLTQRRITDIWRIRRRSRPEAANITAKRARMDRL